MNVGEILRNAHAANDFVRTATEDQCAELLRAEKEGAKRLIVMLRIHSRLNRVRAERERAEIHRVAGR